MRTISIAEISFFDAFGRDVDFHDLYSYYNFRDSKIKEMAEEFLKEHGIKPLWR